MRLSSLSVGVLTLLCAGGTWAQTGDNYRYSCQRDGAERLISVVYLVPEQTVPCEVHYEKDDTREVLWRADNQEGFCERKVGRFVDQQRDWGWHCEKASGNIDTAPREAAPSQQDNEPSTDH